MTKMSIPNEWNLVENEFKIEENYKNETLYALGNGYIGMRGNFEEGYKGTKGTGIEGNYINGFYDSEVIRYGEIAYGYAQNSQTMLNVANAKIIKLCIDDEEFNMLEGKIVKYNRTLSFERGLLTRDILWRSPKGKEIKIEIERLVSLKNKYLAAINYEVTPINFDGKIKIISILDGDVTNLTTDDDPRVGAGFSGRVLSVESKVIDETLAILVQKTKNVQLSLASAMENEIITENNYKIQKINENFKVGIAYDIDAVKGEKICLKKYIAYVTTKEFNKSEFINKAKDVVKKASMIGFSKIKQEQIEFLKEFWYKTDVKIKGNEELQQGIRFNIFHLLQSVGRDGKTNIGAKGLTGEGYEGHYFWDTEIYILPFFLYTNPKISRKLLEYRYSILDKARERAKQMGHKKGALYAWRTINGEECSAYYPAGTAQYHINADIAVAVKRYINVTEDEEFLLNYGAEIVFETARLYADLGEFIENKENRFCINGVTGPDEYTAIVNNNCYTNFMAKENLQYAHELACWMIKNKKDYYTKLSNKISLGEDEIEYWKKASDNMYIPYDENNKIYMQDDSFLSKAPWNFKNTPKENYPLLLHYHPLVIYRHQVCKQADLVLAQFLLSDKFSKEQKKRDFDFYEKITTHDSSLSTCIFSIMANEVGYKNKAIEYFLKTARMDLDDHKGNTKDGIHAANMAGTWMGVVNGFAGMREYGKVLKFEPYIPESWNEYNFKINFKNRLVNVTIDKNYTKYELLEGEPIAIIHYDEEILLQKEDIKIVEIK